MVPDEYIKPGRPLQIEWEARGLAWLASATGGADVVPVVAWDDHQLVTRRLSHGAPSAGAAEAFGRALAVTHQAGATAFGVGPAGWDDQQPGWIGQARLQLGNYRRWGEFYAELRLLPHAQVAHRRGALSAAGLRVMEQLCERLRDGSYDDGQPPARIHGDLWAGNVIADHGNYVMIDPAAHGGHPETDLAMLALFGFNGLSRVQDAYAEAAGLTPGWRERSGLHQLHPLLVHAELFGSSYGAQASGLARRYC